MDDRLSVGDRLRDLRRGQSLSQKELADLAGLSLNAVSLIERDAISPNVTTLQRLATALNVKMSYFFETDQRSNVIFVKSGKGPRITSRGLEIEGVGMQLEKQQVQPFLVTLAPHSDIGSDRVTHSGHEFVCCIAGTLKYEVDQNTYVLEPGDMLLFEAALPHYCQNPGDVEAQFMLVLHTPERPQESVRWHFMDHPSVAHIG
ncbi:MAG TPA: cupin domain-containing protein [Chloroflexia bacterium]|nr:cupin domain-containing protein [Chloroflexia bacterium]